MLNKHIEAYANNQWKAKEPAILDLALRQGIEIPKIKGLMEKGKSREEAILEVAKDMKFQVSGTEAEHWVRALKKERPREGPKKYEEQRIQQEIKEHEKSIERLTTLFSKGEISEESYKRAIKTIERNIEQLRSGKQVSVTEEKEEMVVKPETSYPYYAYKEPPTRGWYLVPLFFGLLGGLIGYVGVKDEDREMALNLLVFGFFVTLGEVLLTWLFLINI